MSDNRRHGKKDLLHTPEGVRDSYGPENSMRQETLRRIAGRTSLYGYQALETPSFEFFDVFSNEIGTTPSRELYKFFDREGNTMVLRPDFTPSVARCAAKYYMDETAPLRFRYAGSVFSNLSSLQGKLRESTQTGAELINDDSVQADAEMIAMLADCLKTAGLTEFQISIGNVEYFRGLCESLSMEEETEEALRDAISGKNYFAAEDLLISEGYSAKDRDLFLQVREYMATAEDLKRAEETAPGERARNAVRRLIRLWDMLCVYGVEKYVSFDLSLLSKYHYYTGVIFKAYTFGTGEPVATGGRYDHLLSYFGKEAPAIGWMIPVDALLEAMRRQHLPFTQEREPVQIRYGTDNFRQALEEASAYREKGIPAVLLPART
ncbi:MAG: ATP phosphoribosyltransferase regulatory subunit [Lachnospiraceae bacterium]|nr:ATP phosphoribosyltransferase regulatory subunit [Lachnospiraceae bacterium]